MATLAELRSFRDRLTAARYGGARELRDQNGETIAFKSDREMASALAALDAEIAAAVGGKRPSTIHFRTSKGL